VLQSIPALVTVSHNVSSTRHFIAQLALLCTFIYGQGSLTIGYLLKVLQPDLLWMFIYGQGGLTGDMD